MRLATTAIVLNRRTVFLGVAAAALLSAAVWLLWLQPLVYQTRLSNQYHKQAVSLFQSGDVAGAEHAWLAAITAAPTSASTYSALGDFYRATDRPGVALACFRRLAQFAPHFPHIYCRMAVCAEDMKSHVEAYNLAKKEVGLDPACPRALDLLAVLDQRSGNTRQSREEAERAYRAAPHDEQAVVTYADDFLPDDPDRAAAVLSATEKYLPNSWQVAYLLGWCYGHLATDPASLSKAVAELRRAETLRPDQGPVHRELCRLLLVQNHAKEAVQEGLLAVQYEPYNPASYIQCASSLRKAGRQPEAEQMLFRSRNLQALLDQTTRVQEQIKTAPNDPALVHQFAGLQERLGNIHLSLVLTEMALAAHPENRQLRSDLQHYLSAQPQR